MINSCKTGNPYYTNKDNLPLLNISRVTNNGHARHDYKIKHINGEEYYIDGMQQKLRGLMPKYSDKKVTASFLAGVDGGSVDFAVSHHKEFIGYCLSKMSSTFEWYLNDTVSKHNEECLKYKEEKEEKEEDNWLDKSFKEDLRHISLAITRSKKNNTI